MTMAETAGKDHDPGRWLALAASPVLAGMALISAVDASPHALCGAGGTVLPIDHMTAMYLLMAFFHLSPWLQFAGAADRPPKGQGAARQARENDG